MEPLRDPKDFPEEEAIHRAALEAFLATVSALDEAAWNRCPSAGGWSPAQIAEHLRLTYVTVRAELEGATGFRVRTKRWQQVVFRWIYLPGILRRGRFPKGVPAVREIRPSEGPFDRVALTADLRAESERFLRAAALASRSADAAVSHPFVGRIDLLSALRFATQHIRHHHRQLASGLA